MAKLCSTVLFLVLLVSFTYLQATVSASGKNTVLFLVLLVSFTYLHATVSASAFCDGKCKARCSQAGVKDRCLKYCGICCKECNCVPSGTYGNKHECPCYRDKLNKKLKPKCP